MLLDKENSRTMSSLDDAKAVPEPVLESVNSSPLSSIHKPCSRCQQTSLPTHLVRRDIFCGPCFQIWILGRVAKGIAEGFRIPGGGRDSIRRVLLPISGGISSLALLHLLDLHVTTRLARTGRAGYEVVVLWVDQGILGPQGEDGEGFTDHAWTTLQQRYSTRWRIERIGIEQVLSPSGPLDMSSRQTMLSSLPLPLETIQSNDPADLLTTLLKSLPEPSSRSDLLTSLRLRLIISYAQRESCSIITWGDTTTRLAEKTLAETAKGRGFSLPWQTTDSDSPFQGIKFMYPLQDLYRREIQLWMTGISDEPALSALIKTSLCESNQNNKTKPESAQAAMVSSRNLTIDELMKRYFQGVEVAYPSVVANVVRTSNKLEPPSASTSAPSGGVKHKFIPCNICGMVFNSRSGDLTAWEGNQQSNTQRNGQVNDQTQTVTAGNVVGVEKEIAGEGCVESDSQLCYACHRTLSKVRAGR